MTLADDRNRLIYGFTAPLLILVAIASLIVATDSGASAEGFAALIVLVMVIIGVPVIIVANMIVVPVAADQKSAYFFRGMIFPGIFIAAMLIYYTGAWDNFVEPQLPQRIDKSRSWESSGYTTLNMSHYFVPADLYDPIDDIASRAAAIAVCRHEVTEDGPGLKRIKPAAD